MSEHKCSCKGKCDSKELPVVIGGIIVYELAIIIGLLVLIFLELDPPCKKPHSCTLEPELVSEEE